MLLWLGLFVLASMCSAANISASIETDGSYVIAVNGVAWLNSASTYFRNDGQTFSSASGNLSVISIQNTSGQDVIGTFDKTTLTWQTSTGVQFLTAIRTYTSGSSAVVFEQLFPLGANATSMGPTQDSQNVVLSSWPSFDVAATSVDLGYLGYAGQMVGWNTYTGIWNAQTILQGGVGNSGPLVLFNQDASTSIVISAFSNFMAHSQYFDPAAHTLSYGLMGSITSVPVGYTLETIVYAGDGINAGMLGWGDALLTRYNKQRHAYKRDYTLQTLGYSTDNGAYYYYNTESGKNYQQTLIDVKTYADDAGIPYRYVLLDSWWYYKGVGDGVKEWIAMDSIFPDGLDYVRNATGWPIQGHNRYWAVDNVYATQNGGDWDFVIENATAYNSAMAVPLQEEFWEYLFSSSAEWGLITYEQDWLDVEMQNVFYLLESATAGQTWLSQFGRAAANNDLTIQYCMSYSRHVLQSVEIPAVTQARASNDYGGNAYVQWNIGITSMFAYAVGLAASKDNYWSTQYQPGNPYGPSRNEPFNRLQAAVSTFSTGPVAPSDAVGMSDAALILRSCMQDGTLLQPDTPATAIDAYYIQLAFNNGGPQGQVWTAQTFLGSFVFSYILSITIVQPYQFNLALLNYAPSQQLAIFEANQTSTVTTLSGADSISVKGWEYDFEVHTVAPVLGNGWTLLGEPDKWVSVSSMRFQGLGYDGNNAAVTLVGAPGEVVTVNWLAPGAATPISVVCVVTESLRSRVVVPAATCSAIN